MAVNPSSKLYEVELGSAVGPDGRFKIIGFHYSSRTTASLLAQATYIAHDMRYVSSSSEDVQWLTKIQDATLCHNNHFERRGDSYIRRTTSEED